MATVQTAAKAKAMAQVGVVQMVVAGVPSHYPLTTSHEPTLFGKTTGIQSALHARTVEEQTVGHTVHNLHLIICAVAEK
jgi:hypothetical protein